LILNWEQALALSGQADSLEQTWMVAGCIATSQKTIRAGILELELIEIKRNGGPFGTKIE
jgi:hypothetical protein